VADGKMAFSQKAKIVRIVPGGQFGKKEEIFGLVEDIGREESGECVHNTRAYDDRGQTSL
jgi:hypothetical protein